MEAQSHPVAAALPVKSRLGPLRAWFGLLFKPRATLERMSRARRVAAWLPAVLMIGVVTLTTWAHSYAYGHYLYADQAAYYAQHPEYAAFAPPMPTFAPMLTILIRIAERLAGLFGEWALWAVELYLICILAGQRDATFGATLKLTLWSWLPYIVRGLLQSAYMFLMRDPLFNPGLSGLLVDNTPPAMGQFEYVTMVPRATRLWGTALAYFDIYLVWHLALLWIGLPFFTRLPRKWAWLVVSGIAVVWIALRVWIDFSRYRY